MKEIERAGGCDGGRYVIILFKINREKFKLGNGWSRSRVDLVV